ncbi:hypothetical protein J4468_02565 [Candidatus Woesearchaeota archaeon]|nr:hypothetical protein [Candidatus Woesearchaeota archaeon]
MKKIIIFGIVLLLFLPLVFGAKVVKTTQNEINLGETLDVRISIYNDNPEEREFQIKEQLSKAAEFVSPSVPDKYISSLNIPYFDRKVTIPPGIVGTFIYRIKPLGLGIITLVSTEVTDLKDGSQSSSNSVDIIVKCIPNGVCESNENYLFCNADCPSGSADNFCDLENDGKCDPDCTTEDVDCTKIIQIEQRKALLFVKKNLYFIFGSLVGALAIVLLLISLGIKRKKSLQDVVAGFKSI